MTTSGQLPHGVAVALASSRARRPPSVRVLVAYVLAGKGYRGAADRLGISVSKVKGTLADLRKEYGADTTSHLAALIYRERGDIFHE